MIPEKFELTTYTLIRDGYLLELAPPLYVQATVWMGDEARELKGHYRDLRKQQPDLLTKLPLASEKFVVGDRGGTSVVGPQIDSASVADVQQAANCLARAGQWAARQADLDGAADRKKMAVGELSLAADLARAAASVLPNRESLGILASTMKRWATVEPDRRDELLKEALDAYQHADATTIATRLRQW